MTIKGESMGAWKTSDELNFLKQLGSFSIEGGSRRVLLQGYLEAAERRSDWGRIDREAVVLAAANLLAMF